jgi:ATP-dependent Clp protease ATP-binding subunit ClpA
MFVHFSDRARKVMDLANQEAQRFNHEYIGTEHILLGLVNEGSGVGDNVLKSLEVDLRKVRLEVEKLVKRGLDGVTMGKPPQTLRAKKVIEFAIEDARKLNHNYVGTEHLLLGLIAESNGVAAQVLMNLGVDLQRARQAVKQIHCISDSEPEPPQIPTEQTEKPTELKVTSLCDAGLEPLIGALVTGFQKQLDDLNQQKDDWVRKADYEKAADARDKAIALVWFKELVIKRVLDTPIDAKSVAGQPWGEHYARMLAQLTVALIESSPDLAAQLGDTLEKLRKAAKP